MSQGMKRMTYEDSLEDVPNDLINNASRPLDTAMDEAAYNAKCIRALSLSSTETTTNKA